MTKRLILLGAPGVGKGTQAQKLANDFNWAHISTGDMLRESMRKSTPLGRNVKVYVEKGDLVPDELMIKLVVDRLEKEDCLNGFLLDGFPRTVPQAKKLDGFLHDSTLDLDGVISIEVSDEEIVKRLSQRLVCNLCGHIVVENDFAKKRKCPLCEGEVVKRQDDEVDTIRHRLRVYQKNTRPLIEYYRNENLYIRIDGMGSIENVYQRILYALGIS